MLALPEGIMDAAVDRRNPQRMVRPKVPWGTWLHSVVCGAFGGGYGARCSLGGLAFGPRAADRSSDAGSVRFEDDAARVHLSARPGCVP